MTGASRPIRAMDSLSADGRRAALVLFRVLKAPPTVKNVTELTSSSATRGSPFVMKDHGVSCDCAECAVRHTPRTYSVFITFPAGGYYAVAFGDCLARYVRTGRGVFERLQKVYVLCRQGHREPNSSLNRLPLEIVRKIYCHVLGLYCDPGPPE